MVVYLIGGPPRCGKTSVARRLAQATGSAWLQTDYLETAFAAYTRSGGSAPPRLTLPDDLPRERRNDALYTRYSASAIVAHYRALAGWAWIGLQPLIEYAIFDDEPLILEGFHLDPADIRRWLATKDPQIAGRARPLFLVRDDPREIVAALRRGEHPNDWVRTKTRDATTFTLIAQMIAEYSATLRSEAEEAGFPVFSTDGDFDQAIMRIVTALK